MFCLRVAEELLSWVRWSPPRMSRATTKGLLGCRNHHLPASVLVSAFDILLYIRMFSVLCLKEWCPGIYTETLLRPVAHGLSVKGAQGIPYLSLRASVGASELAPHAANLWQGLQFWVFSLAQTLRPHPMSSHCQWIFLLLYTLHSTTFPPALGLPYEELLWKYSRMTLLLTGASMSA